MNLSDLLPFSVELPGAVYAALGVGLVCLLLGGSSRRRRPRSNSKQVLRVIRRAPVRAVPVLNQSERAVHRALADIVRQSGSHTLLAQVSMGEFLRLDRKGMPRSKWQTVFNAFNSKRVDFLIVDDDWLACCAIEYQGSGHYQGDARARDAVKRAVCEQAHVPVMEVAKTGLTAGQRRDLQDLLGTISRVAAE